MQKWEYRVTERKDIDISKRGELFNRRVRVIHVVKNLSFSGLSRPTKLRLNGNFSSTRQN